MSFHHVISFKIKLHICFTISLTQNFLSSPLRKNRGSIGALLVCPFDHLLAHVHCISSWSSDISIFYTPPKKTPPDITFKSVCWMISVKTVVKKIWWGDMFLHQKELTSFLYGFYWKTFEIAHARLCCLFLFCIKKYNFEKV